MATVTQGTGQTGGNIEFWPWSYTQTNAANVTNASSANYDFGDYVSVGSGNYGSMQVHNHDASQTLFAFNRWGGAGGTADLGIGNRPGYADTDWTTAQNASAYTVKTLQVFVLPATNPVPTLTGVAAPGGYANPTVVLTFNKPLDDDATNVFHYALSGGLSVLSAILDATNKLTVTLTTTAQQPATWYTVTVSGLYDRTSSHLGLVPSTGSFLTTALARSGAYANVPDAAKYSLVYSLNVPTSAAYNTTNILYAADNHFGVTNYTRIAYYLELIGTNNGATNFIWAAMDPFTQDAGKIGLPTKANNVVLQQPVTNLTVFSSVAGIVAGTNMAGGNIEFWPWNYTQGNASNVANASSLTYDWGDSVTLGSGNYACLQIHNALNRQTLLALDNFGSNGGDIDIGICNQVGGNGNPDYTQQHNASAYSVRTLQVFVLPATDTNAFLALRAVQTVDLRHIILTFSEPVADSAALLANYSLSGGPTLLGAVLSNNLREVIFTTSPQTVGTTYTLNVSGVHDRSANANSIAPGTSLTVGSVSAMATVAANVPEARNYQLAYYLNIPTNSPGWNTNGTTYTVDARAFVGSFTRIAYCLELATNGGPTNWVYASMDAFTSDVNKIGVPDKLSGASFQQKVTNMNIFSSVAGIVTGTGITTGNIEFWPSNYAQANSLSIPNASASTFDFGDQPTTSTYWYDGHGSMQVHNYGASQVLFAYNAWGYARTSDIGIGNQVGGNGNPDYTSMANAGNYAVRNLYVLVLPAADTNAPLIVSATNCFNTTNVLVKFNESLADDAATLTNFSLSGGLTVLAATLRPTMKDILLTTSPQTQGTTYTLTVNGIRDRSTNANLIAANSTVTFTALALPVYARVPEAAGFTLLEYLALPGPVPNYNTAGLTYNLDQRSLITQPVNRIAYYLELATTVGGTTNWIYVSTEAFTTNLNAMGVPIYGLGVFQQRLTNMNVYSSVSGIVTGAGITTGNMEFWPGNYTGATNTLGITTNGNGTAFDWNDVNSGGSGYACMQIHNWGANSTGQVLFAYNHWGGGQSGNTCLGIGTQPATQNMDWTFTENGSTYAVKNLYILVQTTNAPAPVVVPTPMLAPVIVLQPASRTNWVGESTTLAALASGTGPIAGQWRLNGSPLANQTNSWLSFSSLQTGNSGSYDFVATNSVGSVTSLVAVLTVNADPVGPQIVSVGSLDGWDIGIIFDKPIDAGASDLLANLSINAGTISFSSPVLRPDGRTVLLWLDSPVSTPFTVEASYMVNQSGAQTDYSAASGIVLDALASSLNIGVGVGTVDPLYVGSAFVGSSSNFIEVLAGGSGLTSVTDSFHAVSQNLNGDFVAKVQVTGLLPSDPNALAGLMVRPSLANNDRQFSIFTTPAVVDGGAGALQTIIRATSNATATVVGTVSQFAFPNNWVRLQRSGNTFTTAFSSNGVDWIAVTTNTPSPAYPTTIVLGLATTAHNNNPSAYTKAGYASLGIVAPLRILTQPQPASVTADVRTSVTFSNVTVSSPLPVTYQWRKNGVSIPGATGTNLTLANLSLSNAATYTVAVINDFETVISDPCTLTVTNALPIVTPDFLSATQGVARVVSAVSLLGNDSDPEGAVLTIVGAYGQAVTFTTDFNSGLPSGTLTNGNAFVDTTGGVGNSGVLKLTTNGGTLNGWFAVSNLTPGKAVAAFSASFKVLLTGGTATPADGFSFNFGTNYGAPGEEGFATGLSVCFDTYNNGATEVPVNGAPAIDVKWNGVQIGHVMMPIYSNANWQPVGITLNFDGTLDVTFNGTNVYQGFPTGYVPTEGSFILGARTGGSFETHYIDDLTLRVYTRHTALGNTTVGGTVAVTNGVVYYNPPAVGCGSDSFYYIVSDGQPGGTNTGLATVALQWVASGQVTLEGYVGPLGNGNGSRVVTFAATDGATFTNRTVQTLTFTGGSATYSLLVPQGTTRVSVKTAWNLRQTQAPAFAPCQAVANFVLRTGDLDGSNQVDLSDYYLLVAAWYQAGPAADLDGSGLVTLEDYFLMASRWLQTGDPE